MIQLSVRNSHGVIKKDFTCKTLDALLMQAANDNDFKSCFTDNGLRQSLRVLHNNHMVEQDYESVTLHSGDHVELLHLFAGG